VERTRAEMDRHFPGALVKRPQGNLESRFPRVHPRDRHVAAAALAARAHRIVTWNLRDFPPADLLPLGIVARDPDDFLCELIQAGPVHVRDVLESHRIGLHQPRQTPAAYVKSFARAGLQRSANLLWS
jgi:hypothetical protein